MSLIRVFALGSESGAGVWRRRSLNFTRVRPSDTPPPPAPRSPGRSLSHMLDNIWSFLAANPLLVLAICFLIYKQWQARQPWPDFGGNIISLKSVDEWQDTLSKADAAGKVVVVDAYATWCPPCKAAAPVYARMSEEYTEESCSMFILAHHAPACARAEPTVAPGALALAHGSMVGSGAAGLRPLWPRSAALEPPRHRPKRRLRRVLGPGRVCSPSSTPTRCVRWGRCSGSPRCPPLRSSRRRRRWAANGGGTSPELC